MKKYPGSGMIELILVMILLVLFGLSTFMLVISGNEAYSATVKEKNTLSDLRVATSYIDNKIKQHDEKAGIDLVKNPLNGGVALVLSENQGEDIYETWIYENQGSLREAFFKKGGVLSDDMSFEICKLDGFVAKKNGQLLEIEVGKMKKDKMITSQMLIRLQSKKG